MKSKASFQTQWNRTHHPAGILDHCCELLVDGVIAAMGCLEAQPRWMERPLPEIGHVLMKDRAIPGTHQSGT